MLSVSSLSDIDQWARSAGFEIVLIGCGSILAVRLVRWLMLQAPHRLRSFGPFRRFSSGDETPEARRARAMAQATAWVGAALIYTVAAVVILAKCNLPLASLVPPATVAGVAVGFGAQRLVQDLLSGFFLFAERQLTVGDVVRISQPGTTTGVTGTVEEVTLRVTRLRTFAGEVVFVPNGEIRQVTNLSIEWARLVIDVPLRSDEDVSRVSSILAEVGHVMRAEEKWAEALLEDPVVLGVETLDVGYLRVRLMARTQAGLQWEAGRELRTRIAAAFNEAGIVPLAPVLVPGSPGGT